MEGELNGGLGGFQVWVGAGLTEEVFTGSLTVSSAAHITGRVLLGTHAHINIHVMTREDRREETLS